MNIFRILSSHDGSINEPNVSSFLAYLLDPNEDHGLSALLLQELLEQFILLDDQFLNRIKYQGRITDLSKYSGFKVHILPELTVNLNGQGAKKRRDIDILIEIVDAKTDELIYAICLENKITDQSINKKDSQLEDELKGLQALYREMDLDPEIYVLYLTPFPSEISDFSFEKLNYDRKCHLYWNGHQDCLRNKLLQLFAREDEGLIDPINDQSSYLIKSFLSFIQTDFKSYIEERREKYEKKSYGKSVSEHLYDFVQTLEYDHEYDLAELKRNFSDFVHQRSGEELNPGTRNAHFIQAIVNDRNRGHYSVRTPDDSKRNLFYYPAESNRKRLKRFSLDISENVRIYFKGEDEIEFISLLALKENS
jgi:hypothetical protein